MAISVYGLLLVRGTASEEVPANWAATAGRLTDAGAMDGVPQASEITKVHTYLGI